MNAQPGQLVALRPMHADDVERVLAIEREVYEFPWSEGNFRDSLSAGYRCFVYELGYSVIGYAVLMQVLDEAHLLNLAIAREWQGKGKGRRLLHQVIELARGHGSATLYLEVRPSNIVARRLYAESGFREIGQRRDYYPARAGREAALVLELPL